MASTASQILYSEPANSHDIQQNVQRTPASTSSSMIKSSCKVNSSIDASRVDPLKKPLRLYGYRRASRRSFFRSGGLRQVGRDPNLPLQTIYGLQHHGHFSYPFKNEDGSSSGR